MTRQNQLEDGQKKEEDEELSLRYFQNLEVQEKKEKPEGRQ
jgi:hypothetical protein